MVSIIPYLPSFLHSLMLLFYLILILIMINIYYLIFLLSYPNLGCVLLVLSDIAELEPPDVSQSVVRFAKIAEDVLPPIPAIVAVLSMKTIIAKIVRIFSYNICIEYTLLLPAL